MLFDFVVYADERRYRKLVVTRGPRGRLVVIRTEQERLRIVCTRAVCNSSVFIAASGCFVTFAHVAAAGRASRFRSWSRHRRRTRASGCCDHRDRLRHVGVVIAASVCVRAAARAGAWLSTVGSCIGSTCGARAVVGDRVEALGKVNLLGSSRLRRCGAALGVVRAAGVVASISFWRSPIRGPYNTALEPSRPTVRVLFCRCGARLSASR